MKLQIGRSRIMLCYLLCVHALAISMMSLIPMHIFFTMTGYGLCLLSFYVYLRIYGWLAANYELTLRIDDERNWYLIDSPTQEEKQYRVIGSVIFPFVLVVTLRPVNSRFKRTLIVMCDAIAAEPLRQLRVWLRNPDFWGK